MTRPTGEPRVKGKIQDFFPFRAGNRKKEPSSRNTKELAGSLGAGFSVQGVTGKGTGRLSSAKGGPEQYHDMIPHHLADGHKR